MDINYGFILAAGLGTRMGPIGQYIPKILWPVFEKNLLDLQIEYLKRFQIKKIFINTHYLSETVTQYIANHYENIVTISHEPTLLDIGGGIHQVAARPDVAYNGKLLVVNCDQFLWLDLSDINLMLKLATKESPVVLASILVDPKLGYNGIKKSNNLVTGLALGAEIEGLQNIETYGGVAVINLSHLPAHPGRSKFFESIANFSKFSVVVHECFKQEYWDFGTQERFILSHLELLEHARSGKQGKFLNFIVEQKALDLEKISLNGYNATDLSTVMINLKELQIAKNKMNHWEVIQKSQTMNNNSNKKIIIPLADEI